MVPSGWIWLGSAMLWTSPQTFFSRSNNNLLETFFTTIIIIMFSYLQLRHCGHKKCFCLAMKMFFIPFAYQFLFVFPRNYFRFLKLLLLTLPNFSLWRVLCLELFSEFDLKPVDDPKAKSPYGFIVVVCEWLVIESLKHFRSDLGCVETRPHEGDKELEAIIPTPLPLACFIYIITC